MSGRKERVEMERRIQMDRQEVETETGRHLVLLNDLLVELVPLKQGGELNLSMDSVPNQQRGTQPADFPYSYSK